MDEIIIYENGRPAGALTLRREGLYTLLEASLPPSGELTRLWLLGGGERADLGVLEPRRSGRVFCRRYSRAAFSRLPAPMDCAVAVPTSQEPPSPVIARRAKPDAGPALQGTIRSPASPQTFTLKTEHSAPPPAGPAPARLAANANPGPGLNAQPAIGAAAEKAGRLYLPQAAAARFPQNLNLKTENYLALPCELRHPRPGLRLAEIDGQSYLLFRW